MPIMLSPVLSGPKNNQSRDWIQCALKGSNALHSLQFPDVISVTYYSLLCYATRYITRYCKSNIIT